MGKSVDWLDVYLRQGPEEVVRGLHVYAVPGAIIPEPGTRSPSPVSSAAPPAPVQEEDGAGDYMHEDEHLVGGDDALIGWKGELSIDQSMGRLDRKDYAIALRREALQRDVLIRKQVAHPPYIARKMAVRKFIPSDKPDERAGSTWTIARYGGSWWARPRATKSLPRWKQVDDERLEAFIIEELGTWWRDAPTKDAPHRILPLLTLSSALEDKVLRSLVQQVSVPQEQTMPCWLPAAFDGSGRPVWVEDVGIEDAEQEERSPYRRRDGKPILATELIATRDGLLDLDAWCDLSETDIRKRFRVFPHTPRLFNRAVLPHTLDVDGLASAIEDGEEHRYFEATCPRWLQYLDEAFDGDPELQQLAREILADLMTFDRSIQVIHWLQGLPGAGKGTFVECGVRPVVGPNNVSKVSAEELTRPFALTALLGRLVYWIDELRIDRHTSTAALLNLMLSVSGGGTMNVQEKYVSSAKMVDVPLPGRFVVACNSDPNWREAEAIIRRLVPLPFAQPRGKPDPDLWHKLRREQSGIFHWALCALPELRARRSFTQTRKGAALLEEIHRNVSKVHAFARDCCVVGRGNACETSILRAVFYGWAKSQDDDRILDYYDAERFGRELRSLPGVTRGEETYRDGLSVHPPGKLYRLYHGIRPLLDSEKTVEGAPPLKILRWDQGVSKPQDGSAAQSVLYDHLPVPL